MNPRLTLILVVILVLIGGYLYLFEFRADRKNSPTETDGIEIYGTTYGEYDIVELDLLGPEAAARFARTNDTPTRDWEMLQPTHLTPEALDQVRVNGAAVRMAGLTASQVITDVTALGQYGLDKPALTVTLTLSNGQSITLYGGKPTPVDGNRYLQVATENRSVYVIPSLAIDELRRLLDQPPQAPTPLPTITPTSR